VVLDYLVETDDADAVGSEVENQRAASRLAEVRNELERVAPEVSGAVLPFVERLLADVRELENTSVEGGRVDPAELRRSAPKLFAFDDYPGAKDFQEASAASSDCIFSP
jgi:hypothetical protein